MFSKFIASILASLTEEMILDLLAALFRELHLNRSLDTVNKANAKLDATIKEVEASQTLSEEEKNAKLIDAGRDVVKRMRDS